MNDQIQIRKCGNRHGKAVELSPVNKRGGKFAPWYVHVSKNRIMVDGAISHQEDVELLIVALLNAGNIQKELQ